MQKVRAGEVDFGLGSAIATGQDIAGKPLITDVFVAVMPADHPFARHKRALTWQVLKDVPLIGPPPGNAVREQLDFALAREGIALTRHYEVLLPLTILGMVEGGLGIAVMTSAMSRLALALGLVTRDVTSPVISREMSLLFHADRTLSPAGQAFSDTYPWPGWKLQVRWQPGPSRLQSRQPLVRVSSSLRRPRPAPTRVQLAGPCLCMIENASPVPPSQAGSSCPPNICRLANRARARAQKGRVSSGDGRCEPAMSAAHPADTPTRTGQDAGR